MVFPLARYATIGCVMVASQLAMPTTIAQTVPITSRTFAPDHPLATPSLSDELLPPPDLTDRAPASAAPSAPVPDADNSLKFRVDRFEILGNTRFTAAELDQITAPFTGRELSFAEVLQVRSAITKHYTDAGYATTGAIITPQAMQNGVLQIQVVEGQLEAIQVSGNQRLRSRYIRDRIKPKTGAPLNVPDLLEQLQMLRLDPRIANVSADLQAGVRPGTNLLKVDIQEAKTFKSSFTLDNSRSPSVGSFRRKAQLVESNLLGFGDTISVGYTNTKGSNGFDFSYSLPINPQDGNVWFNFGSTKSNVIEKPFTALDIQAKSRYYEFGLRQPLIQQPTKELALGLLFSHQASQTKLGIDDIGPFPLSPGADAQGRTKVSALRFFQEYTQRSEQHVFALRSQFSLGLPWFNANINDNAPDSQFFAWRGQGQWLRQLAPETQFLLKSDVQLAGSSLLPLEQFGLGGQATVRGFRQDALLSDGGALVSAEFRLPLIRGKRGSGVLQLTPFLDLGTTWNSKNNAGSNTLVGTGIGLLWKQGGLSARLDWGIPLSRLEGEKRSLQDRGLYFSLNYAP
jgi:hemolysin activation/secretion protein